MTATEFNDVYEIAELASMIMDFLSLPTLLALSFTSKRHYIQVYAYMRLKLTAIFRPFGLTTNDVILHLRGSNALIMGLTALKAVAPTILPIPTIDHLDIVVPTTSVFYLKAWLFAKCKYEANQTPHIQQKRLPPAKCLYSLQRHLGQKKMVINLLVVDSSADAYKTIINFSPNTAYMNAITGFNLFVPYGSLLTYGKAAHNCVATTMAMQAATTSTKNRMFDNSLLGGNMVQSYGFRLIQGASLPYRSIGSSLRSTNDIYSSTMHLFSDIEWASLQADDFDKPVIKKYLLPTVIWQLSDGGVQGLSFALCDVPHYIIVPHTDM